jgi:hypothetical protein
MAIISHTALACVGCGQSQSFTPKILLVGTGFVILPLSFVAYIAWRLWKDYQHNKNNERT